MSDHADTVRASLDRFPVYKRYEALAALDALVAERDEWKAAGIDYRDALVKAVAERDQVREWVSRIWATAEQEMWDERNGPDAWALALKREYAKQRDEAEAGRDRYKAALDWYADHKQADGSYDGEMWGDLLSVSGRGAA